VELRQSEHGPTLPREQTKDFALAQIGWVGRTGTVYQLHHGPTSGQEPGGYAPLYISVGTWEDLGQERYGIHD
jgi:hypothetical protein